MTADNLRIGPDAQINHHIEILRATQAKAPLTDGLSPAPGIFFGIDPNAEVRGEFSSIDSGLFRLEYEAETKPRWIGMHFELGEIDLSEASIFGVVCKSQAEEAMTIRLCLRSGTENGFQDVFLKKHVVAFSQKSTHVDLLALEGELRIPHQAPWRELILFFQEAPAQIDLHDLKVFIV